MVWVKICGITNIKDADQISAMGADAIGFIFSSLSKRKINFADAEEIIHFLRNKYELNSYSVRRNGNYNCRNKNYNNNYNNYNNYDNCDGKMPAIVGVFVNEEIDVVIENTVLLNLDFVQFSGDEDVNYLNKFKQKIKEKLQSFNKNYININDNLNNKNNNLNYNNLNYRSLINMENNLVRLIKLIRINTREANYSSKDIKNKLIKEISKFKDLVDYFLLDTYKDNVYGGTGETFSWETIHDFGKYLPVILAGGLSPENVKEAINIVKPFGVDASSKLEVEPGKKDIKKVSEFIKNAKSDLI